MLFTHIQVYTRFLLTFFLAVFLLFGVAACSSPMGNEENANTLSQSNGGRQIQVIATTSIVGDVVREIGGEAINVDVLLSQGADPHGFEPSPRDMARIADAGLVFANGAGLEEFLQPLIQNAGGDARMVEVSQGIELLEGGHEEEEDAAGEHQEEPESGADPHVWLDPNNVITWTHVIEETLREADPENAALFTANAENYRQQLQELDAWIRDQVAQVPADRRELVVDHLAFTYFCQAYDFQQVAAIVPGFSTLAEPSARELAQLEDEIKKLGVQVIFVGNTVNPSLAERIAGDTGTRLVQLYTGSLSDEGGEADTYIQYMRFNVSAIVTALRP